MLCQKEARAVSYEIKGTEVKHRLNDDKSAHADLGLVSKHEPKSILACCGRGIKTRRLDFKGALIDFNLV